MEKTPSEIDLIVTVYANASGEVYPIWPRKPSASHWGVQDPTSDGGSGSEKQQNLNYASNR